MLAQVNHKSISVFFRYHAPSINYVINEIDELANDLHVPQVMNSNFLQRLEIVFVIEETPCQNWFRSFVVFDSNLTYDFLDFFLSLNRSTQTPTLHYSNKFGDGSTERRSRSRTRGWRGCWTSTSDTVSWSRMALICQHSQLFRLVSRFFPSKINWSPSERHSGDKENQIFRGETKVPAGQKALRCAWRDRAVFTRPPQHDGSNKGAYERLSQLVISCLQSRVIN